MINNTGNKNLSLNKQYVMQHPSVTEIEVKNKGRKVSPILGRDKVISLIEKFENPAEFKSPSFAKKIQLSELSKLESIKLRADFKLINVDQKVVTDLRNNASNNYTTDLEMGNDKKSVIPLEKKVISSLKDSKVRDLIKKFENVRTEDKVNIMQLPRKEVYESAELSRFRQLLYTRSHKDKFKRGHIDTYLNKKIKYMNKNNKEELLQLHKKTKELFLEPQTPKQRKRCENILNNPEQRKRYENILNAVECILELNTKENLNLVTKDDKDNFKAAVMNINAIILGGKDDWSSEYNDINNNL